MVAAGLAGEIPLWKSPDSVTLEPDISWVKVMFLMIVITWTHSEMIWRLVALSAKTLDNFIKASLAHSI